MGSSRSRWDSESVHRRQAWRRRINPCAVRDCPLLLSPGPGCCPNDPSAIAYRQPNVRCLDAGPSIPSAIPCLASSRRAERTNLVFLVYYSWLEKGSFEGILKTLLSPSQRNVQYPCELPFRNHPRCKTATTVSILYIIIQSHSWMSRVPPSRPPASGFLVSVSLSPHECLLPLVPTTCIPYNACKKMFKIVSHTAFRCAETPSGIPHRPPPSFKKTIQQRPSSSQDCSYLSLTTTVGER